MKLRPRIEAEVKSECDSYEVLDDSYEDPDFVMNQPSKASSVSSCVSSGGDIPRDENSFDVMRNDNNPHPSLAPLLSNDIPDPTDAGFIEPDAVSDLREETRVIPTDGAATKNTFLQPDVVNEVHGQQNAIPPDEETDKLAENDKGHQFPAEFLFVTKSNRLTILKENAHISNQSILVLVNQQALKASDIPHKIKETMSKLPGGRYLDIVAWVPLNSCYNLVPKRPSYYTFTKAEEDDLNSRGINANGAQKEPNPLKEQRVPLQSRFNMSNFNKSSVDFMKGEESKNTVKSVADGINDFMAVIRELHPEETKNANEIEPGKLNEYLQEYFKIIKRKDGKEYLASSLGTKWNTIAYFLRSKKYSLDISVSTEFLEARNVVAARKSQLTAMGFGPGMTASQPIDRTVWTEMKAAKLIGNTNPTALTTKIVLDFQAGFGMRARLEIREMNVGDVILGPPSGPDKLPEFIQYSTVRLTKIRRGGAARALNPKIFRDDEDEGSCPVRSFLFFMMKKPAQMKSADSPMFLNAKHFKDVNWKFEEVWYVCQPMGVNSIGALLPKAAAAAGFDSKALKITATSARKSSIDNSLNSNVSQLFTSQVAGHKNGNSISSYGKPDAASQEAISRVTNSILSGNSKKEYKEVLKDVLVKENTRIEKIKADRGYTSDVETINPFVKIKQKVEKTNCNPTDRNINNSRSASPYKHRINLYPRSRSKSKSKRQMSPRNSRSRSHSRFRNNSPSTRRNSRSRMDQNSRSRRDSCNKRNSESRRDSYYRQNSRSRRDSYSRRYSPRRDSYSKRNTPSRRDSYSKKNSPSRRDSYSRRCSPSRRDSYFQRNSPSRRDSYSRSRRNAGFMSSSRSRSKSQSRRDLNSRSSRDSCYIRNSPPRRDSSYIRNSTSKRDFCSRRTRSKSNYRSRSKSESRKFKSRKHSRSKQTSTSRNNSRSRRISASRSKSRSRHNSKYRNIVASRSNSRSSKDSHSRSIDESRLSHHTPSPARHHSGRRLRRPSVDKSRIYSSKEEVDNHSENANMNHKYKLNKGNISDGNNAKKANSFTDKEEMRARRKENKVADEKEESDGNNSEDNDVDEKHEIDGINSKKVRASRKDNVADKKQKRQVTDKEANNSRLFNVNNSDDGEVEIVTVDGKNSYSKVNDYKSLLDIGSLVLVKIRGFGLWPGKVINKSDGSFTVCFYGDFTIGIYKINSIQEATEETISQLKKQKVSKKLKLAIDQVESNPDLIEDPTP